MNTITKRVFFRVGRNYFRMYIFFEIDHLNSFQKKPAGYRLTLGEYDNPAEA
jgi:hypothetical protein